VGTGDILYEVLSYLKNNKTDKREKEKGDEAPTEKAKPINVCLIGRPNVGKSSLLNSILGYDRVIVSPLPHTTREPQNTELIYKSQTINLVDTAGISQHGQKSRGLEKPGIIKTLKSLDKADIALLVLDMSETLSHQDAKLVQEIFDRRKSLIIIANKWDLIEKRDQKHWTNVVFDKLPFATWASLLFLSAKTGEKVNKILDLILEINEERQLTLSDSQADKFLRYVVKVHRPARGKGLKMPHIYEFRQVKSNPPAFICRIGANDDLHFSYVRFLENRLREKYGFTGTPINIRVTKNRKSHTTYNQ
jgi:GTP-binding protein